MLVTADDDHEAVDRRRIELLDNKLPAAPIHHRSGVYAMHDDGDPLDDDALGQLANRVRASATSNFDNELHELTKDLPGPIETLSLRDWPDDFPADIATLRRSPYESQADSVMYREVMANAAEERGWRVHRFDANTIEAEATGLLGINDALQAPRSTLGAPWNKDHRIAFAAAIVAARSSG